MSKKKSSIPIFIAIPNQGSIHIRVANMITEMVIYCYKTKKYEPTIRYSKVTGIDHNRNEIAYQFLKTDCQWLLMIDDDNPPLKNPLELIELNKDVIVCPTLMYKGGDDTKIAYNVFKEKKDRIETLVYRGGSRLQQIDRGGSGCILIRRDVLESMDKPFESIIDQKTGRRIIGEDIAFSLKARQKGFKIFTHWGYSCSHYKVVDLLDVARFTINTINRQKVNDIKSKK